MDIDAELERWQRAGEQVAVATVVAVRGSSPRAPGARLATTASGLLAGSVSGGCVESEVCRRAREVIETGVPVIASFAVGETADTGVGLTCGGGIDVLIECFVDDDSWRVSRDARARSAAVVRAVVVAPARLMGRRITVTDSEIAGAVAPELDPGIVTAARALLRDGGESGARELTAGALSASVLMEVLLPPARLFIVGATDTAAALTTMAKTLGFRVIVIDARQAYASSARFPGADEVLCAWPGDALRAARLDERSHVVTLAHDPKLDVPALAAALGSEACYIGALGSRRTHERRVQSLIELGFRDAELARIHAPIGLDLGGRAPEEIAVAIASEIVAARYGRESRSLVAREEVRKGAA